MVSCLQLSCEKLNDTKVKSICEALNAENLRMLSVRECKITDKDYKKIMKNVSLSKTILQLSLNVGIIKDQGRVKILSNALQKNRSLISLLVNGNPLGDEGMKTLGKALSLHPNIVSLDVGDCNLGNDSIEVISDLLPPHGAKPGLTDLTMSANSDITPRGWSKLAVAIAASSTLRELYLDYNTLGDYAASCILVALTAHRRIEVLDLEGTGITDHTAQLLSYLVDQYPVRLRKVVLDENNIKGSVQEAIKSSINWNDETTSETQSEAGTDISKSEVKLSKEVKVHPVNAKDLANCSKNDTLLGMFSAVSEKSREDGDHSDFKDTATTDEDYKALAKALEAGLDSEELQNTGGMSPTKADDENESDEEDNESDNEDDENNDKKKSDNESEGDKNVEESEEGEELNEVPVVRQSKIVFVATAPRSEEITTVKKDPNIGTEIVDDNTEEENKRTTKKEKEEELKEVPIRKS